MKELIIKYINNLSKEDIVFLLNKENIILNNNELDIVYTLLKNDNELFFNNKDDSNNYLKLINLYNKYENYL